MTGSAATLLGGMGVTSASSSGSPESTVDSAPYVENAKYATVGTNADNPTATVYGNFKCPYTKKFVLNNFSDVIDAFVQNGKINVEFRQIAYEPNPDNPSHGNSKYFISSSDGRIAEVGLGAWNESPGDYWQYFYDMFQQEPSGKTTLSDLRSRLKASDVSNRDAIISDARQQQFDSLLHANTKDANDAGFQWTPWMVFQGDTTTPDDDTQSLLNWIDARIPENSGSSSGSSGSSSSSSSSGSQSSSSGSSSSSTSGSQSSSSSSSSSSGGSECQG